MGPLTGVKVVEIASLAPAPFGCMILADLGADVLRVDRAGGPGGLAVPSGIFDRGRRTIAVDLKSADGVGVVQDVVAKADVFVEGFRPGVAERLGIGPETCAAQSSADLRPDDGLGPGRAAGLQGRPRHQLHRLGGRAGTDRPQGQRPPPRRICSATSPAAACFSRSGWWRRCSSADDQGKVRSSTRQWSTARHC